MKYTLVMLLAVLFPLLLKSQEHKRPTVGLVLSGGAAKGFAHVGVLKVLESAGIRPDYVAGTSMGSLVGGMYAAGYSPDDIQAIARGQNWNDLLTDKFDRRNISIYEKNEADRIFLPITFKNRKVTLTAGVSSGQKVHRMLSNLSWGIVADTSFDRLSIPFFCAATDVEHGRVVYLDHGYLPDAIRASISIPTMFDPEEYQGLYLVDGGLIDNMPVMEMKRRYNPDYIIAVDVGAVVKDKKDLSTFTSVLSQCIFMMSNNLNHVNREAADLVISPDLHGYGVMNFGASDTLIRYGEISAAQILPQLQALIDTLAQYPAPPTRPSPRKDTLYISQLRFEGLKKVPRGVLISKLGLVIPGYITKKELDDAFNETYGSLLFYSLDYKISPSPEGDILTVRVTEKNTPTFSVGLHYDNEFGADVLFGASLMNKIVNGSKLTLELLLGGKSRVTLKYNIFSWSKRKIRHKNAMRPDFGMKLDGLITKYYTYEESNKVAEFNYSELSADIYGINNFGNSSALTLGAAFEVAILKASINPLDYSNVTNKLVSVYLDYELDNQNDHYFPDRGHHLYFDARLIHDFDHAGSLNAYGLLNYNFVIPCGKIFSIIPAVDAGTVTGNNVAVPYMFYLGGSAEEYGKGIIPFYGKQLMEYSDQSVWRGSMNLRFKFLKKAYATGRFNVAQICGEYFDGFIGNTIHWGGGATLSYNSFIGPLELSYYQSYKGEPILFLNFGFRF